jgi:CRISPR-associated protein Cmr2
MRYCLHRRKETSMNHEEEQIFWKRKLMAFLHDAPGKALDIGGHEACAAVAQRGAGFADEQDRVALEVAVKPADWFSASAERFVFPKGKCSHDFKEQPLFIHPLSSRAYPFPAGFGQNTAPLFDEIQAAAGGIVAQDWHEKFFLYWRRWLDNAADHRAALAFLPADSRIPDHTIWNHMSVASALAPCITGGTVRPELLLFQLGPVQDFIAQARSTRDLWSGSYLISWLMAHAMKAVSDRVGPDAIIFPSLRGNGIFDALHRERYYATPWQSGDGTPAETTWERLLQDQGGSDKMADWLLTPTLPNRFLAIVPQGQGPELAEQARVALVGELKAVGEAVWAWFLREQRAKPEWLARWDAQVAAFPQIAWAVQPWLDRDACLQEAEKLPKDADDTLGVAGRLRAMITCAEQLPDKDSRFYVGGRLNNAGVLWSAHYALLDAKLAARRNTRDFVAWDPVHRDAAVKDSLSGKEECIGDEEFWANLSKHDLFSKAPAHRYGAMNLIKRLWCRAACVPYLRDRLGLKDADFEKAIRFDSVQDVADGDKYVAVLAMDGDQMGKWVSGAMTPALLKQLAPNAHKYLEPIAGGRLQRLLTPSYHLQFSEALANFAMHKARAVVESWGGELIYAGGDDVLAILPAKKAIACARALREAFCTDYDGRLLLPGGCCEVSCGLAVGHENAPLQMLVKEAQKAEKRAKLVYDRGALAISLYKRSGEIIEWGCKWKSNALDLMAHVEALTDGGKLSGRFPYALAALLQPYALEDHVEAAQLAALRPVVTAEVRHVLARQGAGLSKDERDTLASEIAAWLDACWPPPLTASGGRRPGAQAGDAEPSVQAPGHQAVNPRPQDFINLLLVETFINRQRGEG